MAITLLHDEQLAVGSAASGSQTYVISPASGAGSTLMLTGFTYYGAAAITGPVSITDSASNAWQHSVTASTNPPTVIAGPLSGSQYYACWIAWALAAAPVTAIHIDFSDSFATTVHVTYSEWAGIVQAGNGSTIAGTAAGTNAASAPVTLSNTGELVTGVVDGLSGLTSPNPPAGTTSFPSDGTGYQWYVLPGTAGSYTATYNNWNSGTDYAMALMAFSPVSLGAGAVPYQMRSTRRGRRTS